LAEIKCSKAKRKKIKQLIIQKNKRETPSKAKENGELVLPPLEDCQPPDRKIKDADGNSSLTTVSFKSTGQ